MPANVPAWLAKPESTFERRTAPEEGGAAHQLGARARPGGLSDLALVYQDHATIHGSCSRTTERAALAAGTQCTKTPEPRTFVHCEPAPEPAPEQRPPNMYKDPRTRSSGRRLGAFGTPEFAPERSQTTTRAARQDRTRAQVAEAKSPGSARMAVPQAVGAPHTVPRYQTGTQASARDAHAGVATNVTAAHVAAHIAAQDLRGVYSVNTGADRHTASTAQAETEGRGGYRCSWEGPALAGEEPSCTRGKSIGSGPGVRGGVHKAVAQLGLGKVEAGVSGSEGLEPVRETVFF